VSVSCSSTYILCLIHFRLTQKHDGKYLSTVVANCLTRFGLEKLVCLLLLFYNTGWSKFISSFCPFVWIMPVIMMH
jgi:hypothetical protein